MTRSAPIALPPAIAAASQPENTHPVYQRAYSGHADAQLRLGEAYWKGLALDDTAITQDLAKARYWLQQAARQEYSLAQRRLAEFLLEQDQAKEAVGWFEAAVNQGDAPAQFLLGRLYHDGDRIPGDLTRAAHYWEQAARQGYAPAEYALGLMHYGGKGIKRDPLQALQWFHWAAEHGHPGAQFELSQLYCQGTVTNVDADLCRHWLLMAASAGNQSAQAELQRRGWQSPANDLTSFTDDAEQPLDTE